MKFLVFIILSLFLFESCASQPSPAPSIQLQLIASGYNRPNTVIFTPDGKRFIINQTGLIYMADSADAPTDNATPFLNISNEVHSTGTEQGLLGLAFHPDYPDSAYFFVDYTANDGNTHISRFQISSNNPDIADPTSEEVLLSIPQPYSNHNGGCIVIGPDNYLYIGMGDGGSGGDPNDNAQNITRYLGKILRIDIMQRPYGIPPSNPFADSTGVKHEIWDYGMRNPWRYSFDRLNGDLWIGDVGQNINEEVDHEPAGSAGGNNYGWRCYEGNDPYNTAGCTNSGFSWPVYQYTHSYGGCSITGGYRYRGQEYPALYGKYLFADYCSGYIWALSDSSGQYSADIIDTANSGIVSFGQDLSGELYIINQPEGKLYRIKLNCGNFSPDSITNDGNILHSNTQASSYQWFFNGDTIPGATDSIYQASQNGSYSVWVTSPNGNCASQLAPFSLVGLGLEKPGEDGGLLFPNPANGQIRLVFKHPVAACNLELLNLKGKELRRYSFSGGEYIFNPMVAAGCYILKINRGGTSTYKYLVLQ